MLQSDALPELHSVFGALAEPVDAWLLFDFRGINPIMSAVVGPEVVGTRRAYVYIPRVGDPVAIVHAIDAELWREWPEQWRKVIWIRREELIRELGALVMGRTLAIEYSPGGAIPYGDYVPAGTVELLRALGAAPVSSVELVTRYCSRWSDADLAGHVRAAKHVAAIARGAFAYAGERARTANPCSEFELATWVLQAFERAGLETNGAPSVSYGANAARSHYEPTAAESDPIVPGALLLLDLWAKEPGGIYADQTWMASVGTPSAQAGQIWQVVRDARDAALTLLRSRLGSGQDVVGGEADRAARDVIAKHGYAGRIVCRTGHSIDRVGLHGYGPTLDDTESFDTRRILPGVGFSVEPGVYIPGEIGVRSEVNAHARTGGLDVTPVDYQNELILI